MPTLEWNLTLVHRKLDDSVIVTEPLLFPEISCCDTKVARLRRVVRNLGKELLKQADTFQLHARALPAGVKTGEILVMLDPPKRQIDWDQPIKLRFGIVHWQQAVGVWVALLPALGIEVVATRQTELSKLIGEHVLTALRRTKAVESLFQLALTQRTGKRPMLKPLKLKVLHKSPKQTARDRDAEDEAAKKPVIKEVGLVLGELPLKPAYEIQGIVTQMAEVLSGRSPSSLLLIGASGVGKTAAVHELVRTKQTVGMSSVPFWTTSGSRLIAGMAGFGMWQQRCQRLCKEASRDGAILHLGSLVELMQVGRVGGSQGIAGYLKSPIARGEVLVIAECTPEQLTVIERQDPALLQLFYQLRIEEPDSETGRRILRKMADEYSDGNSRLSDEALQTLDRLHRRYATYSAAPGRSGRFLQNLLQDQPGDDAVSPAQVIAAFSRETGLPLAMLDPEIPLDLSQVQHWFASRLIGQSQAIHLVADLLATVKASLTRPRRPIASLLFAGPTGVGKTEMAKALAEYFFGDRERLTRFDMSEFATAASVERLIGGVFGGEGLLTAKVREQPFSVILLDEFEKAHSGFFDLLLQVLGEGRLTDAAGRVGDFSNAIVILTSNLGAESFGRGSFGLNRGGDGRDAGRHFTEEVRSFVRPELFNRIDRIVPFLPLDTAAILKIADRELTLVQQRDGFKLRGVTMSVMPAAQQHLAERGYDIRYGARPLKRAIERQLLAPLAEALSRYPTDIQLCAEAGMQGGNLSVSVRAALDAQGRNRSNSAAGSSAAAVADACAVLRRDVQRLLACPATLTVTNLLFQLEKTASRKQARAKAKGKHYYDAAEAERIAELRQILNSVETLSADTNAAENLSLSAVYANSTDNPVALQSQLPELEKRLYDIVMRLHSRQASKPHRALIGLFGNQPVLVPLAAAYYSIAKSTGFQVQISWYDIHTRSAFRRHHVDDVANLFEEPEKGLIGIALRIDGPYAYLRFGPEKGVHVMSREGKNWGCLVDASDLSLVDYAPPGVENWPKDLTRVNARRTYDLTSGIAKDPVLGKELRFTGRSIEPVVSSAIEQQLMKAMRAVIES